MPSSQCARRDAGSPGHVLCGADSPCGAGRPRQIRKASRDCCGKEDGTNGSRVAPRRTAVRSAARHRLAGKRSERFSTASSCGVIRGVRVSNVGACHDDRRWLWVLLAVTASEYERRAISRRAERPSERATREPHPASRRTAWPPLRSGSHSGNGRAARKVIHSPLGK